MARKRPDIHSALFKSDDKKTVTWDRAWRPGPVRRVTRLVWKNASHVPDSGDLITAMWTRGKSCHTHPPVIIEDYAYRTVFGQDIITGRLKDSDNNSFCCVIFGVSIIPGSEQTRNLFEIGYRNRFIISRKK